MNRIRGEDRQRPIRCSAFGGEFGEFSHGLEETRDILQEAIQLLFSQASVHAQQKCAVTDLCPCNGHRSGSKIGIAQISNGHLKFVASPRGDQRPPLRQEELYLSLAGW